MQDIRKHTNSRNKRKHTQIKQNNKKCTSKTKHTKPNTKRFRNPTEHTFKTSQNIRIMIKHGQQQIQTNQNSARKDGSEKKQTMAPRNKIQTVRNNRRHKVQRRTERAKI